MLPAIKVENLSKQYLIGTRAASGSFRDAFGDFARSPLSALRRDRPSADATLWALKDVSFEIQKGDVVGFVGHNGAGKSTLLKVLSRIVAPTTGRVQLHGRVGSLLEVGTGFHPELTGRENIYLNGAVLGMRRSEISARFDEIVSFSEIERFLDTPVKRYSSGMYTRLAFAVAAHLETEVLIVDEVLAVGDVQFQKKCMGKMGDAARQGRTVLFVSHNMQAVANLCSRAVLLQAGQVVFEGSPLDTINEYHKHFQTGGTIRTYESAGAYDPRLALHQLAVRQEGDETGSFLSHLPIEVEMEVSVAEEPRFQGLVIGFALYNDNQLEVFSSYFDDLESTRPGEAQPGRYRLRCTIPANFLQEGNYRLVPDVGISQVKRVADVAEQVVFAVNNVRGVGSRWQLRDWRRNSTLLPHLPWQTRVDAAPAARENAVAGRVFP